MTISLERSIPRKHLVGDLILFVLWVAMIVTAYTLTPSPEGYGTHTQLGLPPCAMKAVTGNPCPTCGMTTSFAHILDGNAMSSFRAHPLGLFVFSYMALGALYFGSKFAFGYRVVVPEKAVMWANIGVLLFIFGFGIIRWLTG